MAYTPHTWQTGETVDAAKLNANEQGTQAAAAAADTANTGLAGKVNSSTYTAGLAGKADYPAGGTDGQSLVKAGSTTAWATVSAGGTVSDASTTAKGIVQLAGDLGGTAAAPAVKMRSDIAAYNFTQSSLRAWHFAYAKACNSEGRAAIVCYGDSVTSGYQATSPQNSWVSHLRALIEGRIGITSGTGLVKPLALAGEVAGETRFSYAGTWGNGGSGPGFSNTDQQSSTGGTITIGPITCDRIRIYYLKWPGGGTATVTLDGSGAASINANSSTWQVGVSDYTATQGTHTLVITAPNSGVGFDLLGWEASQNGSSAGIRVDNLGHNGAKAADLNTTSGTGSGGQAASQMAWETLAPNLAVICFGLNEAGGGTVSPATYQTNVAALVTKAKAVGASVLLLVPPPPSASFDLGGNFSGYVSALYAIADAQDCALLDLSKRWPSDAVAQAAGLKADGQHPNDRGYWDIANFIGAAFLSTAVVGNPTAAPAITPPASDATAPSTPTGLAATAGNAQVSLSWTASTDNVGVTGYRVYRGGTLIASPTTTTYTDTGLTNGTAYSYTVAARDAAGNVSAQSSAATATPSAPSGGGGSDTGPALSTLRGAPTYSPGKIGNALSSGALATAADITAATGTVELWVKTTTTGTRVAFGNDGAATWVGVNPTEASYNWDGGGITSAGQGFLLNNGAWHHIAVTFNGTSATMFIDGTQVKQAAYTGGITFGPGGTTAVGGYGTLTQYDFTADGGGMLDEIRISNAVRYTGNFTPQTTPFTADANTLALYHLDS